MTGYVRVDTGNNIADGNVISAADLDNEFDGVQAAFNASTGHTHDGSAGEGAPITKIGPTQDVTASSSLLAPKTTNTVDVGSSSLKFKDLYLAGNASIGGTLAVTGVATFTAQPVLSSLTANQAVFTNGTKGLVSNAITGTGNVVMSTSPTLVTPDLGTPSSAILTNATGLPVATGISGLAAGVAAFLATPSSSNLATVVTDETGTGALVFANSPTLVSPALGTPSSGTVTNLTGTASININGTVGATTPNTGAFTTLSASGAVTHNGGTANGVAYLNGSKVLTTGSALTFDGTNLLQATGGAAAVFRTGSSVSSGRAATINLGNNVGVARATIALDAGTELMTIGSEGNFPVMFQVNGSEQMRLTSTGLGIGTSSPSTKLNVVGDNNNAYFQSSTGTAATYTRWSNSGGSAYIGLDNSTGSALGLAYALHVQSPTSLAFHTNGSGGIAALLDTSGNLGLGVTPSAWATSTGTQALQIGSGGVSIYGTGSGWSAAAFMYLSNNAYYSSSAWRYLRSVPAAQYVQASGAHQWFSAGSGTAGNAISFTQAMTLDASGNLGVGTTSPTARLTVVTAGTNQGEIRVSDNATYYGAFARVQATDEVRIGSYGASQNLTFYTVSSERARIDSSGNLLVGTTSSTDIAGTSNNGWMLKTNQIQHTASGTNMYLTKSVSGSQVFISFYSQASAVGAINTNGTTTSYVTTSDYRLKNDPQPMQGALAKVAQLKPCTYTWKLDGSDGQGFIAHELQAVVPDAVFGEKDAVDADGNPVYQGIDTSFLVATLTAALQEAHGLIKNLQARVDALEAK